MTDTQTTPPAATPSAAGENATVTMRVWRGDDVGGEFTDYVMRFAPLGVFAAMAAVITTQGVGVLVTYGKFVSAFYFGLAVLWMIIIGAGSVVGEFAGDGHLD